MNVQRMLQALALLVLIVAQPSQAAETVRYIHTDALGSVVAVTDASGAVIERREYEPYGAQLTPAVADGPGYTGHVQDAATGLTYMQQRYYDSTLGMFLSVDPVTAYDNPINQFHRYRYANSSPYRFVDPDGRVVAIAGTKEQEKALQTEIKTLASRPAGRALYDKLSESKNTHTIRVPDSSRGERNSTQATSMNGHLDENGNRGKGSGSTILVDPAPENPTKPVFVSLAHEMGHATAMDAGEQSKDFTREAGTTPPGEVQSMEAENAVRREHGLPERASYYPKDTRPLD
ncbi:hypothetical protein H0E84_05930 [Luteimonas sp. SJ-92]|uniref:Teneurin-like YD-shell domain-containing protein n=1 Tax=Luteimonas salinisoli TaxID=2752307 RepID=A0A853JB84_9GAMM|nr:RHS repeat-associated core domain-containing protein [Luteimonas salinisoli]NZA25917.1 hypothetical protein [Luteimonas salinisoli]